MKRLYIILFVAIGLFLTLNVQGQGSIYLNSFDSGILVQQYVGKVFSPVPIGTFVEVFGGPTAGSMVAITPFGTVSPIFNVADAAGDFDAGYAFCPNIPVNTVAFFQVFCWIGPANSHYTDFTVTALAASPVFTSTTGDHPAPPNILNPGALNIPENIYFVSIPEPGTLALAGLGAAALLVFRRRK
jgi:hypothetical protein